MRGLSLAQLSASAPAPEVDGPIRHHVSHGESMDGIARRYGIALEDLLRANPSVEPRRLKAGAWLEIPAAAERSGASGGS
jgi:LysM repeat protein